ncbi:hypothetical protein F511_41812 [Dorcoceras hygrometricum]|uniref:Uncharacterized protein n=1 Tax=Dorcoceras hygrometricum TaxID=472368 RepID=A0A2Z7B3M3_9LAMI|nr:hypothetical protein F511_41812 [Dorcoceras hygrometricum]
MHRHQPPQTSLVIPAPATPGRSLAVWTTLGSNRTTWMHHGSCHNPQPHSRRTKVARPSAAYTMQPPRLKLVWILVHPRSRHFLHIYGPSLDSLAMVNSPLNPSQP